VHKEERTAVSVVSALWLMSNSRLVFYGSTKAGEDHTQLARELRAKGYKGSLPGIYRYLETLKGLTLTPSKHKRASKTDLAHGA
jgi:hypothetical protein